MNQWSTMVAACKDVQTDVLTLVRTCRASCASLCGLQSNCRGTQGSKQTTQEMSSGHLSQSNEEAALYKRQADSCSWHRGSALHRSHCQCRVVIKYATPGTHAPTCRMLAMCLAERFNL